MAKGRKPGAAEEKRTNSEEPKHVQNEDVEMRVTTKSEAREGRGESVPPSWMKQEEEPKRAQESNAQEEQGGEEQKEKETPKQTLLRQQLNVHQRHLQRLEQQRQHLLSQEQRRVANLEQRRQHLQSQDQEIGG